MSTISPESLKLVSLDDVLTWKLRCPGCSAWGHIDDDQLHGRVSLLCECGWHETHDLSDLLDKVRLY